METNWKSAILLVHCLVLIGFNGVQLTAINTTDSPTTTIRSTATTATTTVTAPSFTSKVTRVTLNKIVVAWTPAIHINVSSAISLKYIKNCSLTFKSTADSWVVATLNDSNRYNFTIDNLDPSTCYFICVTYTGPPNENQSDCFNQSTIEQPLPNPPSAVKLEVINYTALQLSWSHPERVIGVLLEYQVAYTMINCSANLTSITWDNATKIIMAGNASARVIDNLEEWTCYAFKIRAKTRDYGVFSETIMNRTMNTPLPSAPSALTLLALNSTSMQFLWSLPENVVGTLTAYQIAYIMINCSVNLTTIKWETTNVQTVNVTGNVTDVIINGLQEWMCYVFKVKARTRDFGTFSDAIRNKTSEAAPSQAVAIDSVRNVSSTALLVKWIPLPIKAQNGLIRRYDIYYNKTKCDLDEAEIPPTEVPVTVATEEPIEQEITPSPLQTLDKESVVSAPGNATSVTLSNLTIWACYSVRVVTVTVSDGPSSTVVKARTDEGLPSVVQQLKREFITSDSIGISWVPPLQPNGVIINYKIYVCSNASSEKNNKCSNGILISDTNYTVHDDVLAFTRYKISVEGLTSKGSGPKEIIFETTLEANPSQPRNLTAYPSPTTMLLSWHAPEHPNGIVYYLVCYQECSGPSEAISNCLSPNKNTTQLIEGLHEYICYTFTVLPFTQYGGNGTEVNISTTTHPTIPSGSPRNLTATDETSTSFNLTWLHPALYDQNGPIDNYVIYINDSRIETIKGNTTHFLVTSLCKYCYYEVKVAANNTYGVGPFGNTSITTLQDFPGQVANLQCVNLSSTSLQVSWDEPSAPNGIIKNYFVSTRIYDEKLFQVNTTYNRTKRMHIATGLEIYTDYKVSVYAGTTIGFGMPKSLSCKTSESVPSAPSNITFVSNAFWLDLKWQAPNIFNGLLKGYTVTLKLKLNDETVKEVAVETAHANITLLSPYTFYVVSVAARTSAGSGDAVEREINTDEWIPSRVGSLQRLEEEKPTSLSIRWKPPETPNGIVTYSIYVKESVTEHSNNVLKNKTKELSFKIFGLEEFQNYTITVQPSTTAGSGPNSSITLTTAAAAPSGAPINLTVTSMKSTKVSLKWSPVESRQQNGIIESYSITHNGTQINSSISTEETSATIENLEEYTYYKLFVKARNQIDFGPTAEIIIITTEDLPGKPRWKSFDNVSETAVKLRWLPPSPVDMNGIIISYRLNVTSTTDTTKKRSNIFKAVKTSNVEKDLEIYHHYKVSLEASTLIGWGPAVYADIITSVAAPSGPPISLRNTSYESRSVALSWSPPTTPNGPIIGYQLKYIINGKQHCKDENLTTYTINNLLPFRRYVIGVACESLGGIGPFKSISIQTAVGAPPKPIPSPQPTIPPGANHFTIKMWRASNENGRVQYYWVIVIEGKKDENGEISLPAETPADYSNKDLLTYEEYVDKKRLTGRMYPYIAANIKSDDFPLEGLFIVGDKQNYPEKPSRTKRNTVGQNSYYNGPLNPESTYYIFERAFVDEVNYVSSADWIKITTGAKPIEPPSNGGTIAGVVVSIMILLIAAIIGIYVYRRHTSTLKESIDIKEMSEISKPGIVNAACDEQMILSRQPVQGANFAQRLVMLNKNGGYQFSEEFKLIKNDPSATADHSIHPINREKNRYNNIVAYDHTRVCLIPRLNVLESDYINANFIQGFRHDREYIAAQGPLENTCEDFWRMVWEYNVPSIVMLTRTEENGKHKCYPYWPDAGSAYFGCMQVTVTETVTLPGWRLNTFSVINDNEPEKEKFVKHFHYLKWPDHGVPSEPQELLAFLRKVNNSTPLNSGPTVVHCSAGVGRTGTYIVLDVCLRRLAAEGTIDIFNFLKKIRSQRNYMVQTEAQYIFIHNAVNDHIVCGVTEIQARNVRDYAKKLQNVPAGDTQFGVDLEFQKLNNSNTTYQQSYTAANLPCNKEKNRFLNILPFDSSRVSLRMLPGVQGSDYINANFVDGYLHKEAFIATQAPLPTTIVDFWRMIWEQHCATIVCLAKETESGKVIKVHRYWPSIEAAIYGPLMIESLQEKLHPDFIVRELKVTHMKESTSRVVCQFQFTSWPHNVIPDSGGPMVDFIGHVLKWQSQSGSQVVTVHCSAGVGRSGVFIALSNLIERVKSEGVVDVFQAVRMLRAQRPAMVQTKGQYLFCYLAMLDYLASFDIYANFI